MHRPMIWCALVIVLPCVSAEQGPVSIAGLADEYVSLRLRYDPSLASAIGVPEPEPMHLPDRGPASISNLARAEDDLLRRLRRVGAAASADPTYAVLLEELESRRDVRVCRREFWDLSQTQGWQVEFPARAAAERVATPEDRRRALQLWSTLPAYLHTDMANLRAGLAAGYSTPKSIVRRVLTQLDALGTVAPDQSPFYAAANRTKDSAFKQALRHQVQTELAPAIREYAHFLRSIYLHQARNSLGLDALPDGEACYRAYLRQYTTTQETPGAIYASGQRVVAQSTAQIQAIGAHLYGTDDLAAIIARTRNDSANRFTSPEQLLAYSRAMVTRSIAMSRPLFSELPPQPVVVRLLPAYQRGTGVGSRYEANANAAEPATFWISTDNWSSETRAAAEITAVHETVPGHHLQIATASRLQPKTLLEKLVFNAAYTEGWAHYAEQLAEEQGIDGDDYERVQRRVLAGRSMVIDPGIHALGWTRRQAESFAMETGMSKEQADETIDRIAVEPGQLTSYEVGGLEILRLRDEARSELGKKFSLPAFHERVLEEGSIPLTALRAHVEDWLRASREPPRGLPG